MKTFIVQKSSTLQTFDTWNAQFYVIFNETIEKVETSSKEDLFNELEETFIKVKPFIDFKKIENLVKNSLSLSDQKIVKESFEKDTLKDIFELKGSTYYRIAVVLSYILTSSEIKNSITNSLDNIELELRKKLEEIEQFKSYINKI